LISTINKFRFFNIPILVKSRIFQTRNKEKYQSNKKHEKRDEKIKDLGHKVAVSELNTLTLYEIQKICMTRKANKQR
jgi:hypothetical protein